MLQIFNRAFTRLSVVYDIRSYDYYRLSRRWDRYMLLVNSSTQSYQPSHSTTSEELDPGVGRVDSCYHICGIQQ